MWSVGKSRYSRHTEPRDISSSFTIAIFIHQNRLLYMLHNKLNHFCGSSSHSPQPPRVNVKSTIRKEPGRSLQRLFALTSSQSSQLPQHSWAVASDLGIDEWVNVYMCQNFLFIFLSAYLSGFVHTHTLVVFLCDSSFCLLFSFIRYSNRRFS